MASVMAIVSKKIFETEARGVGVGDVWPTDRYLSKTPGLRALDAGGSLLLVTVRPEGERLWLVAVLESPKFDGEKWTAKKNATPVTDVTHLLASLKLESGAGVKAEPGKLGMSLQTPRALTEADVALLLPKAKQSKAKARSKIEEPSQPSKSQPSKKAAKAASNEDAAAAARERAVRLLDASNMKALDALAAKASKAGAKGWKDAAQKLGQTEAALAALDWGTEALVAAGAGAGAVTLYKAARALEKKLDVAIDEDAAFATMTRLADGGALDDAALATFLKGLAKRKQAKRLEAAIDLVARWLERAGSSSRKQIEEGIGVLSASVVEGIEALSRAAKDEDAASRAFTTRLLPAARAIDPAVIATRGAEIAAAIDADASFAARATDLFPRGAPTKPWRDVLASSRTFDRVLALPGDGGARWVERLLQWMEGNLAFNEADAEAWLEAALDRLAPALRGRALDAKSADEDSFDVAVLEALLRRGAKVATIEGREINVYRWATRSKMELDHVARDPSLRALVQKSFDRIVEAGSTQSASIVARFAASAPLRSLFDGHLASIRRVAEHGTIASLEMQQKALALVLSPEATSKVPALAEALAGIDPAKLLARTLRLGILDELSWPLHDATNDRLAHEPRQYALDGPFPFLVMPDEEGRHVVVIGPEGVALEADLPASWPSSARSLRYVDGDLFYFTLESSLKLGRWLSKPDAAFDCELYPTWTVGARTKSGAIWDGQHVFTKGEPIRASGAHGTYFSDGERCWIGRDEFDPDKGEKIGKSLPRFFEEVEARGATLDIDRCSHYVVPRALASSPLGVKDGIYAFRVFTDADGRERSEGVDGRAWEGSVEGCGAPIGLLRMPAREGLYPIAKTKNPVSQEALFAPDGATPLVPGLKNELYWYWAGASQWLPLAWWHYLVPRDLEGSRALAKCSDEAARDLLDVARAAIAREASDDTTTTGRQGTATFAITKAPRNFKEELAAHPELVEAVAKLFPEITAQRLRTGVAAIAFHAAKLEQRTLTAWKASSTRTRVDDAGALADKDVGALSSLFGRGWNYGEDRFEASVRDADDFLSGSLEAKPPFTKLCGSKLPWRMLFLRAASVCRRVLAPATPDAERKQLRRALELWASTSMAKLPEKHRAMVVRFAPRPPAGVTHEMSVVGASLGHRYVLQTLDWNNGVTYAAIERSDDGAFVDPPGGEVIDRIERSAPAWDAARMSKTLTLLDAKGPFAAAPEAARAIAERTGLLYPSALVLFSCAHPWEMSRETMQLLGLKRRDLALAEKEIAFSLDEIYDASAPLDPEAFFDPLAKDREGKSVVDRLCDAWIARLGVRTPLDVELLERMEEDFHATKDRFHRDVRLLEEGHTYDWLTNDTKWVVRPWTGFKSSISYMQGWIPPGWPKHASQGEEEKWPDAGVAFGGAALRTVMRLFPYANLELPAGDKHRVGAANIAELVRARLTNPDLLLLAGAIDLSRETNPDALAKDFAELRARFEGAPYRACDGGASAEGVDRGDLVVTWPKEHPNSFFLAFRPAKIEDAASLDRLAKDLGVYDAFRRTFGGCSCGLNFGRHNVVDITDLRHWLVWIADPFQRMLARLASPKAKPGRFEADARESAPDVVDAVRKRHDVSADAAALYLALATLPDPDARRAKRYLAMDEASYSAAASSLIARKLIVEKKFAGTKRDLFLPGEVKLFDPPIAPMEAHKLALYGLEEVQGKIAAPFGVVLPLAPLDELFARAWKAIDLKA